MRVIMLGAMLLIGACSNGGNDEAVATEEAPFDDLTNAVDRADAVEQQVLEQKDRLDRALDEAEKPPESRH